MYGFLHKPTGLVENFLYGFYQKRSRACEMYGFGVMINVNLCKKYIEIRIKNLTQDAFQHIFFQK